MEILSSSALTREWQFEADQGAPLGGSQDIYPHCSSLSAKGLPYQEGNHDETMMKPWSMLLYWEGTSGKRDVA